MVQIKRTMEYNYWKNVETDTEGYIQQYLLLSKVKKFEI